MSSPTAPPINLDALLTTLKQNLTLKDRHFHLTTYKSCFLASEAVTYMLTAGLAETRQDAVNLGLLLQQSGHIEHCLRDHNFKDAHLFYKFIHPTDRGGRPKCPAGHLVSWADFLPAPTPHHPRHLTPSLPLPSFQHSHQPVRSLHPPFWPLDQHNVTLLDNVRPAHWIQPQFDGVYSLVVLGAGAAGLLTALGAAGVGARVALVEGNVLGGDCLNVGCVPSKALIHAANLAHALGDARTLAQAGVVLKGASVAVDFAATMKRLRGVRASISHVDSAERYAKELGVDVYFGYANFTGPGSVEVNGTTLKFKKAVVATGGYPAIPAIEGLADLHERSFRERGARPGVAVVTNETVFNLTELPKRFGVIGTGVIGMELAQAMQRLGSQVTMFGRSGNVLPKEDADLAAIVKAQMEKDGVEFRLRVEKYDGVELTGNIAEEGYEEVLMRTVEEGEAKEYLFDAILVSAGRKPNVANLGLEKAGVEFDTSTGLKVNDTLQTTNPKIYGVGDCCSAFKFTHVADFMARMVIRNALFFGNYKMSSLLIPYATFTSPELAHVGLYEKDMKEQGIPYKTFEKHFDDNDRAICDGTTEGLVRIHVEDKSDRILGASICGEGAGNMISEITLAIQSKTGLGALASVIHPYPTTGEAIRQAGDLYNRTRLTNTVKQILRGIVKFQT